MAITLHQYFWQTGVTLGMRNTAVRHDGSVAEKQEDPRIKAGGDERATATTNSSCHGLTMASSLLPPKKTPGSSPG
jgi:hypothetical protein